jgi:hypothetical protein
MAIAMGHGYLLTVSECIIIRSCAPTSLDAVDKIYAIKFIVEKKLLCILMQLNSLNINIIIYTFIPNFSAKGM